MRHRLHRLNCSREKRQHQSCGGCWNSLCKRNIAVIVDAAGCVPGCRGARTVQPIRVAGSKLLSEGNNDRAEGLDRASDRGHDHNC